MTEDFHPDHYDRPLTERYPHTSRLDAIKDKLATPAGYEYLHRCDNGPCVKAGLLAVHVPELVAEVERLQAKLDRIKHVTSDLPGRIVLARTSSRAAEIAREVMNEVES